MSCVEHGRFAQSCSHSPCGDGRIELEQNFRSTPNLEFLGHRTFLAQVSLANQERAEASWQRKSPNLPTNARCSRGQRAGVLGPCPAADVVPFSVAVFNNSRSLGNVGTITAFGLRGMFVTVHGPTQGDRHIFLANRSAKWNRQFEAV